MDSLYLRIPLINTENKKCRTLDSPSILISFGNTGSKRMTSFIEWIGLVRVANN